MGDVVLTHNAVRRLAVVDDDRLYLRSLRRAMARDTRELELALFSDAASLLEYVAQQRPDMIVVDVFMPGMDGLEACRRLRTMSKEMMIAVASCDMTPELRRAALVRGASFAFEKAYDLTHLIARIDELCHARARLIAEHVGVALDIAAALARLCRHVLTTGEVESLARLGLCQAAARFDPERAGPFAAFAAHRIRGAVLDEVRRLSTQTRSKRARPQVTYVTNDDDWPPDTMTPVVALERAELLGRLDRSTASLSRLEAKIIELHYRQDEPLLAIAQTLGMDLTATRRLHTRALVKLRRALA